VVVGEEPITAGFFVKKTVNSNSAAEYSEEISI